MVEMFCGSHDTLNTSGSIRFHVFLFHITTEGSPPSSQNQRSLFPTRGGGVTEGRRALGGDGRPFPWSLTLDPSPCDQLIGGERVRGAGKLSGGKRVAGTGEGT